MLGTGVKCAGGTAPREAQRVFRGWGLASGPGRFGAYASAYGLTDD